ncbi:CinA family protein [Nocardia stercoris]|uniref:CinA family protein n=1 Tax=Nocardia stercoris TaxID=2483361 RepID=A0A3M2KY29_9NOCA|nr:CinA family protein [Nocardia stercoris]RMI29974.1 CinA family protein [Nocardia stercoris]
MSTIDESARRVAAVAVRSKQTVAIAESLTCGQLSSALGAAPDSAQWLRGAVVSYSADVKRQVLGVPDVPVVSETAARAMAIGVRKLLGADVAVAVTGVGGPDPQDGEPAGSVWLAVHREDRTWSRHEQFDADPEEVLRRTVEVALEMVRAAMDEGAR